MRMRYWKCLARTVKSGANTMFNLKQATIGSRLNPQNAKPKSPPWFEGWYTRVIGPDHSFGLVTGYFPEQAPKHAGFYTALLFNDDIQGSKLRTFETLSSNDAGLHVSRGEEAEPNAAGASDAPDFCFEDTWRGAVKIAADPKGGLLVEGNVQGAKLSIKALPGWEDTPWSEDGGSPQGLLHLVPGVGLHWYVHSTKTKVQYELHLPADDSSTDHHPTGESAAATVSNGNGCNGHAAHHYSNGKQANYSHGASNGSSSRSQPRVIKGEGWAHVEKNWGGSFPRSFIWAQGFPTAGSNGDFDAEAQFCLAGGVLPTLNMDKLPVPLPNALLLGYRSKQRTWHFKPHSPSICSTTVNPEQGLLIVTARQLSSKLVPRTLVLKVEASLDTFSQVAGPTRGGFVPHSVESYSAKATAECYEWGRLVEVTSFNRSALEFGGSYACALEKSAGRGCDGLACEPQWEE